MKLLPAPLLPLRLGAGALRGNRSTPPTSPISRRAKWHRADLQRQGPRGLGRQQEALVGEGWRHRRPDDGGASDQAQHFLVFTGGTVENFELTFKYKIIPHNDKGFANSGVQYRSKVMQPGDEARHRRLPGRLRGRPDLLRHPLRGERPRHPGQARREDGGEGRPGGPEQGEVEVVGKVGDADEIQANRPKDGTTTASSPRATTCSISSTASRPSM